jgi:hypothetical protein
MALESMRDFDTKTVAGRLAFANSKSSDGALRFSTRRKKNL